jgi:hypothetical protein
MGELILRYGSQCGIGISELGPNCRNEIAIGFVEIGLTLKRGKGPDLPTPDPACGPHPVCTGPSLTFRSIAIEFEQSAFKARANAIQRITLAAAKQMPPAGIAYHLMPRCSMPQNVIVPRCRPRWRWAISQSYRWLQKVHNALREKGLSKSSHSNPLIIAAI